MKKFATPLRLAVALGFSESCIFPFDTGLASWFFCCYIGFGVGIFEVLAAHCTDFVSSFLPFGSTVLSLMLFRRFVLLGSDENGDAKYVIFRSDEDKYDEEEETEYEIVGKAPLRKYVATVKESNGKLNGEKEMVTLAIIANLLKQGYKIIGSHSGIKICIWTRLQL
ncbi:hypothetical protein KIW84_035251 [Lathyrus oleraceus]|uniref:Uncharacterized protein n=1 Tax=Pisum sativum TaxID=3888 RepID=A0A9D4Y381_PEA|nr:hypothetical protein KIW84_035251 [Pisum sativum]